MIDTYRYGRSHDRKQFTSRQLKEIEYVFDSQTIRPIFFVEYLLSGERYIAIHAAGSPFDTHARSHSLTYTRTLAHSGMPPKPCQ